MVTKENVSRCLSNGEVEGEIRFAPGVRIGDGLGHHGDQFSELSTCSPVALSAAYPAQLTSMGRRIS